MKTNFILIFFALILASVASAQTTQNIVMLPAGAAHPCETTACDTFVPNAEPFVLLMKATNNQTTKYTYTVIATLQDGTTRVITGQANRSDDNAGYTPTSVTLGCDPVSVDATVQEAN